MRPNAKDFSLTGFELLRPLDGKACRVWLARETALGRDVAIKFQAGDSEGCDAARDGLLAEAEILSRCDHPSIVPFYRTVPNDPPTPAFYAMKALPTTLQDLIASGRPIPENAVRRLGREIAGALAYLHGLSPSVAHGGVSAANILIDFGGRAVLAGFGAARILSGTGVDSAAMAADVRALGHVLEGALAGGPRCARPDWKPLLKRMLADDPAECPTAAEVAQTLAEPPRRRLALAATAFAAVAAAIATAGFGLCDLRIEPVVDETISPLLSSSPTLRPRLPPFSPETMRRIPWYYHLNTFSTDSPEIHAFESRLEAFQAEHPEWKIGNGRVFPGMLRILRLPGDVQLEMAVIPHGYFRRGFFLSSNSAARAECKVAPETVLLTRPYWMARTELTRAQYAAVMRRAPAVAGHPARRLGWREGRRGRPLDIEGGDLPVGEDLDLADVQRFIDALNKLCGLEGEQCFRLPTEAEWENACRAFVARRYEGEPNPGDAAWMAVNSGGVPHPVAQKAQNPLGVFDLHGNLAEWCADAYGPLGIWVPFDPYAAPASNDAPRVVRGGSFRDAEADCDSDARAFARPTDKGHAIRLVAFP